ncbi:MAG: diacylglycerol kinase family protein [Anaerolineae bacterium]
MMTNSESMRAPTLLDSFRFAFAGVWYVLRTQRNAQIHTTVAALIAVLGVFLRIPLTHWAIMVLTMGFVIVAEMFNTVAETALDVATTDYHPLVKVGKDVAAGAVLVTAITAVLIGLLILGPPLWQMASRYLF